MHLNNSHFFLAGNRARDGVTIVVAFKNLFTLRYGKTKQKRATCFT